MRSFVYRRNRELAGVAFAALATSLAAEGAPIATGYNSYGQPGLIDMPVATSRPDGELAFTTSSFAGQTRTTLTFQVLPRLSGSFRYSVLDNVSGGGTATLYDRSFSLHYRLLDETARRPAVAVGLNDFLGTGVYASEYVVATKSVGQRLRFSAGMGWGRLGTSGGFANPLGGLDDRFETRPRRDVGTGGEVEAAQWFRGDAALFGGVEWQATDRLRLAAEYASDAYPRETPAAFRQESQLNFAASYKIRPGVNVSLSYLYGSELGLQITAALDPKTPPGGTTGLDPAPPPVLARSAPQVAQLSWPADAEQETSRRAGLADALARQGIRLHGLSVGQDSVRVEIENTSYLQEAQAVGRTARVLSRRMPSRVRDFVIVPVASGVAVSELRIRRDDLEELTYTLEADWRSFTRTRMRAATTRLQPEPERYPRFDWRLRPYLSPSYFDPDNPIRADFGAQLDFGYEPMRGLEFSGSLRKKIIGNLDESTRLSNSVLPHVRSDFNLYDKEGDPALTDLTAAYYFKPGRDLYARTTVGYLERMFGGVSSELLWKPVDSRVALGVEVNYTKQRDFDQLFGFQDYEVATGHVSAYWDMGNGFHAQVDAGRYLARDWGATVTLDREFGNGWTVGAFATLTDVPFDEFGEGSFDKGIRIEIPISWLTGEPNKTAFTNTIRPLTRDGGARLNVEGRLYERVRPLKKPALRDGWGRFWR